MSTIKLKIRNKKKLQHFMDLIKDLDYVEILTDKGDQGKKKEGDLFAIAGIWEDRNINLDELREKAWRRK